MLCLISAQVVEGDLESAQNNIRQLRNYMRKWPTHLSRELQQYYWRYNKLLSMMEHYMNTLTETHTACIVKGELIPPTRVAETDECSLVLSGPECRFVSKIDGSVLTLDDLRKALGEQFHDPFPLLPTEPQ
jgi:hypothetical protein